VCAPLRTSGIKKQACINRKCLLMVPRDEDGERLARKRAKQRQIPPGHFGSGLRMSASAHELGLLLPGPLTLGQGLGSGPLGLPAGLCESPCDSPIASSLASSPGADQQERAARAQALSERTLTQLALDDERPARAPAMLFAAIHTPASSPHRGGRESAASGGVITARFAPGAGRTKGAELDLGDDSEAAQQKQREVLSAASAHIAAKLGDLAPPKPPGDLDELHETFMLLNAEHHRCAFEGRTIYGLAPPDESAMPILAF